MYWMSFTTLKKNSRVNAKASSFEDNIQCCSAELNISEKAMKGSIGFHK
jgi:hypothetical protein